MFDSGQTPITFKEGGFSTFILPPKGHCSEYIFNPEHGHLAHATFSSNLNICTPTPHILITDWIRKLIARKSQKHIIRPHGHLWYKNYSFNMKHVQTNWILALLCAYSTDQRPIKIWSIIHVCRNNKSIPIANIHPLLNIFPSPKWQLQRWHKYTTKSRTHHGTPFFLPQIFIICNIFNSNLVSVGDSNSKSTEKFHINTWLLLFILSSEVA